MSYYYILFFLVLFLLLYVASFLWRHTCLREHDLAKRYGRGTWVLITGASSGQGKRFALEFAERGFNLFLIGSIRTQNTIKEIKELRPGIKTIFIERDFGRAFEDTFFEEIDATIAELGTSLSVLINSVGHRTAWEPYHEMPLHCIRQTIAAGTMVQSRLIYAVLPIFLKREAADKRSAIVNLTAQVHGVTVPYLSVYEAANYFGYAHANSIYEEYKCHWAIDFLNITPGAVLTENTRQFLCDTWFAIEDKVFVKNVLRLMGNVRGITCGSASHELSQVLGPFVPAWKERVLHAAGKKIARHYMKIEHQRRY